MNRTVQAVVSILGRLFLVTIFLMSAVGNKIPQFGQVSKYMASEGVPAPDVLLAGAIVFLLIGGLTILFGYYARFGAVLLLIFLAAASYYFHDFWKIDAQANPAEFQQQMIHFMKNLGLMGAMLLLIANGSGAGSLGGRMSQECQPPATT